MRTHCFDEEIALPCAVLEVSHAKPPLVRPRPHFFLIFFLFLLFVHDLSLTLLQQRLQKMSRVFSIQKGEEQAHRVGCVLTGQKESEACRMMRCLLPRQKEQKEPKKQISLENDLARPPPFPTAGTLIMS